jgi:Acyl-CoA dehydrogenase N terminal
MPQFVNRRDIDFMLYELLKLEKLFELPHYRTHDRATITHILDTAEAIAREKCLPVAAALDIRDPKLSTAA